MVRLLAREIPAEAGNGRVEEPLQALGDERLQSRGNCKSIYIRSRKCRDRFAISLCLFGRMATWSGTRYRYTYYDSY